MTQFEVLRRIDDDANGYIRLLGDAAHMESLDNGRYCVIFPKPGEQGVSFVYDIRPECLNQKTIREIKRLEMPVWWPLLVSDKLYRRIHNKARKPGGELYMAIFPREMKSRTDALTVKTVESPAEFARWAAFVQQVFCEPHILHARHHYPLCERGTLRCFYIEKDGEVLAAAAVAPEDFSASLEFVAVDPAYRRQGLASAVCTAALEDTFARSARLVTLRASEEGTRELYSALGFQGYDLE